MKNFRINTLLCVSAFGAALMGTVLLSACEDPTLYCTAANGDFNARLDKKSGDDDCLPKTMPFSLLTVTGKAKGRPDFGDGFVIIQDHQVLKVAGDHALHLYDQFVTAVAQGKVEAEVGDDKPSKLETSLGAKGNYTTASPNAKDICKAKTFDTSFTLPAVDDDPATGDDPDTDDVEVVDESMPETTRSYKWSEFEVEISPDVQGSIFWAELEYEGDGCKATYDIKAVWPATGCAKEEEECFCGNGKKPGDADCAPTGLSFDFYGKLECLDGACVFRDVKRK